MLLDEPNPNTVRRTWGNSYGNHALTLDAVGGKHDVWHYVDVTGLHPTRVNPNYEPRHAK